jgi:hypothetical protein
VEALWSVVGGTQKALTEGRRGGPNAQGLGGVCWQNLAPPPQLEEPSSASSMALTCLLSNTSRLFYSPSSRDISAASAIVAALPPPNCPLVDFLFFLIFLFLSASLQQTPW